MLTQTQLVFLSESEEFQHIIDTDKHLSFLLSENGDDRHFELLNIVEMLGGVLTIGNLTVQPVTPALWAFLWIIGNHYATDIKKVTELDTDIFLYFLSHGIRNIPGRIDELPAMCAGTVKQTGLTYPEVASELLLLIYHTFRPMELIPGCDNTEPVRYDSFWLANLVSVVSKETGHNARNILFNMPLSACLNFYAARCYADTPKLIYRRKSNNHNKTVAEYMLHLGETYCRERGIE